MANELNLFGGAGFAALDCRPKPACDPRPVCPACGGLECLCRPRFFAGQLLTDEDLNRLDHYIVAKNRLHNRHLFGSGVVCGLEVVCSTCDPASDGTVVVKPGYALSPCGNDIVVCAQESVNVCDLIDACRPRNDECYQPARREPDRPGVAVGAAAGVRGAAAVGAADQGTEDWVLAICYAERPSRGVTALRGASCGCGTKSGSCGCGGHLGTASAKYGSTSSGEASCGCGGGGGSKTASTRRAAKSGPRPPQCEPTLTCESYTFAVYKVPPANADRKQDFGALIDRFVCCIVPLFEQLPQLPANNPTPKDFQDWLTSFIQAVRDFLISEGLYDCDVVARIGAVVVPEPGEQLQQYMNAWTAAFIAVVEVIAAVFQKCLCAALLPPCPPPEMNDCVPIATLTMGRGKCRVKHICNISHRRFLVTWPSVQYWLSWLPLFSTWIPQGDTLRKLIEGFCCTPIAGLLGLPEARRLNFVRDAPRAAAAIRARRNVAPAADARVPEDAHPFTQLMAEAMLGDRRVDAPTLLLAALGATKKDGASLASDLDLRFPGQAMLVHQILAPAMETFMPLLGAVGGGQAVGGGTAALERSVAALKKQVEAQAAAIAKLQKR